MPIRAMIVVFVMAIMVVVVVVMIIVVMTIIAIMVRWLVRIAIVTLYWIKRIILRHGAIVITLDDITRPIRHRSRATTAVVMIRAVRIVRACAHAYQYRYRR